MVSVQTRIIFEWRLFLSESLRVFRHNRQINYWAMAINVFLEVTVTLDFEIWALQYKELTLKSKWTKFEEIPQRYTYESYGTRVDPNTQCLHHRFRGIKKGPLYSSDCLKEETLWRSYKNKCCFIQKLQLDVFPKLLTCNYEICGRMCRGSSPVGFAWTSVTTRCTDQSWQGTSPFATDLIARLACVCAGPRY